MISAGVHRHAVKRSVSRKKVAGLGLFSEQPLDRCFRPVVERLLNVTV